MEKYDYLRKHALNNVFISPSQDRQAIIKPSRLTPDYGRKRYAAVDIWSSVQLPDSQSDWHVYQIGAMHPVAVNFFVKCDDWTSLAETCNNKGMLADAYSSKGVQLPKVDTFYRYTENGSLILAVKINENLNIDFDLEDIYIRVYTNAYFNSIRYVDSGMTEKIVVDGLVIGTGVSTADLFTKENELRNRGYGYLICYHNGIMVKDLSKANVVNGDTLELVFDSSVDEVLDFQVKTLQSFESTLDLKRKLLIHCPKGDSFEIDYNDDIDIFLVQKFTGANQNSEIGVYHHKNKEDSIRNLTHKDYSLVSSYVREFGKTIEEYFIPKATLSVDNMHVRLLIRKAGVRRELQFEHNRIRELYKLPDSDIVKAMVGIDSTVSVWRAPALEESEYMKILRSQFNDVTVGLTEKAYMYNASSKYLGDTPVKVVQGNTLPTFVLPLRARHGCTVYEYNEEGLLIGWHHHLTGLNYAVKSDLTRYAEVIIGLGGNLLDDTLNPRTIDLNDVYTYRVYSANKVGDTFTRFVDITGTDKYEIVNNKFTWLSADTTEYPIVRSDARFLARDYQIKMTNGHFEFEVTVLEDRGKGQGFHLMRIPMGQLDVFLNGRSLIRGLDYFYKDFKIVITNKEFLRDPLREVQDVHVRFTGFCKKDLSIMEEGDLGFIEHGLLSNNNKYDIRDDKVQRVIVGGRFYHKDDLIFSENHTGVSVADSNNGQPYMVKDILVPIKPYTFSDTYEMRDTSLAVDKEVSDYMTIKFPQPPRGDLVLIPKRYEVFSPFLTKIIMDLRQGYLRLPSRQNSFTVQEVLEICKPYEYLLETDPVKEPNSQDSRYVIINPHPMPYVIELNINNFTFVQRVIDEYCKDLVLLSPSVRLT